MDGAPAKQSARWFPLAAAVAVAVVAVVTVVAALLGGPGDDGPERGRVHRPASGAAGEDVVRRLAAALGVAGDPRRDGEGWTVGSGDITLEVSDEPGQPWWYGQVFDEPMPVEPVLGTETGGLSRECAPDAAGATHCEASVPPLDVPPPEPAAAPVSEDAALSVVGPLLATLALTDADVRSEAYGDTRAVSAAPRVAGLPTQGWETRLEVGADGEVRWASGMLGGVTAGEEYPLVGAHEAFDLLTAQPHPDIAVLCAPGVPCARTERVVTGAEPGLQLQVDDEGALLVPAWLFTVRDAPHAVGQVAVAPAHLAPPEVPVNADEPVTPADPVEPADPDDAPVGRATFPFDRAARGTVDTEVVFGYGDSSSCPHTGVVPLVDETDDVVTVTLEADAMPPDRACTADYVGVDVTVPLERPLGDRTVVDGATGMPHELR